MVFPERSSARRALLTATTLVFTCSMLAAGIALTSSSSVLGGVWPLLGISAEEGKLPDSVEIVDTSDQELSPPEITLEQIESLLERNDLQAAVRQALVWQRMLRDFGVAESDRRLFRLREIIQQLGDQLRPGPTPQPMYLKEFRQALHDLREAVRARDLVAGREALKRIDNLLDAHPNELKPYGRSVLALEGRPAQLERDLEGRGKIRDLLTTACALMVCCKRNPTWLTCPHKKSQTWS